MKLIKICFILLAFAGFSLAEDTGDKVFTATAGPDNIQKVNITGGEYFFDPNRIIIKANVPVELSVRKAGGLTPHSIVINAPEAGIVFNESLDTEPKVIKFTPVKTGVYHFSCTKKLLFFKSHEERGMKGAFEVVE